MPAALGGLFLGLDEPRLRALRPAVERQPAADTPEHYVFDESLAGGGQAVYVFARSSQRLARVQLAQQHPGPEGLSARFQRLQRDYGPVSGVWDCAAVSGQLPTRRFSWLRGSAGAMDVVLLLGERVLTTLYVGSREDIERSLDQAHCAATPPERFSKFPAVPLLSD